MVDSLYEHMLNIHCRIQLSKRRVYQIFLRQCTVLNLMFHTNLLYSSKSLNGLLVLSILSVILLLFFYSITFQFLSSPSLFSYLKANRADQPLAGTLTSFASHCRSRLALEALWRGCIVYFITFLGSC